MDIDKKIEMKLKNSIFTREDLTGEEIEKLKWEISEEEKGNWVLDGVLARKPIFKISS